MRKLDTIRPIGTGFRFLIYWKIFKNYNMKKIILNISIAFAAMATVLVGCSKDDNNLNQEPSNSYSLYSSEALNDYQNIGAIHNLGLAYLQETNNLNYLSSDFDIVTSFSGRVYDFLRGNDSYVSYDSDSLDNVGILSSALENGNYANAENSLASTLQLAENIGVSSHALECVNAINSKFEEAKVLAKDKDGGDALSFLIVEIAKLESVYNEASFENNLDRGFALGYMYTALHSLKYWQNSVFNLGQPILVRDPDNPGNPPIEVTPMAGPALIPILVAVAKIDAAGYLYGWGRAMDNGIPNPECRIAAGKATAMEWSGAAIAGLMMK